MLNKNRRNISGKIISFIDCLSKPWITYLARVYKLLAKDDGCPLSNYLDRPYGNLECIILSIDSNCKRNNTSKCQIFLQIAQAMQSRNFNKSMQPQKVSTMNDLHYTVYPTRPSTSTIS